MGYLYRTVYIGDTGEVAPAGYHTDKENYLKRRVEELPSEILKLFGIDADQCCFDTIKNIAVHRIMEHGDDSRTELELQIEQLEILKTKFSDMHKQWEEEEFLRGAWDPLSCNKDFNADETVQ